MKDKYQAVGFTVVLPDDFSKHVETSLIGLGQGISKVQIDKFRAGSLRLKPNLPNLKGRVGWDSNLKGLPGHTHGHEAPINHSICSSAEHISNPTCLVCPRCKANELSSNKAFQLQDLDEVCRCNSCKQNVKAKDWLCHCHVQWHLCSMHQSCTSTTIKNVPGSKPCQGAKRALGPLTNEQLMAIDTKRIRSAPTIRPPTPSMLSVKLRERFAHLF